ncbi:MAG: CvpA family protein [Candidatus Korobacteraceae bacterium]
MSAADWGIVAIVLFSMLMAAAQGFFYEVVTLAGMFVGFLIAAWGYGRAAVWFLPYVSSPQVADIAGYLALFIGITLLAGAVGRIVRWAVKGVGLRWFDRLLGAAFGLVRGLLAVTVVALGVAAFAPGSRVLAESRLAPYLLVLGRGASWLTPSQVREQFRGGVEKLHKFHREKGEGVRQHGGVL